VNIYPSFNNLIRGGNMIQIVLTPSAGKRLIGKAVAQHPSIKAALKSGILTIVAGTTNGYVAEEILGSIGQADGFSKESFFRGVTMPLSMSVNQKENSAGDKAFPGDVVIVNGKWQRGRTIYDVVDEMKEGDVILKGANALDLYNRTAAVLIGNPEGGTIIASLRAAVGKRVRLIIPVGLEKRVFCPLNELALKINAPGSTGLRLLPVYGEIITEIQAISILSGACAEIFAAGGICGAEGAVWIAVSGNCEQEQKMKEIADAIAKEPRFCI